MSKSIIDKITKKEKSREELIEQINQLKKELKNKKKYGLVWEEIKEDIVEQCKEKLPILREEFNKGIVTDKEANNNILIEGDNYHALSALCYTHENKVDVIYIDPPYNTGKKRDFRYNDEWIDKDNAYKHSKWLQFMSSRLKLARRLLKNTGVIFISIDKNEVAQLRLLCNEIFLENNYVEIFNWVKTETPSNLSNKSKEKIEYIICFEKKKNNIRYRGLQRNSSSDNPMMKNENTIKDLFFKSNSLNIKLKDQTIKKGKYGTDKYSYELLNDLIIVNNKNQNEVTFRGRFIWTQDYLDNELKKDIVAGIIGCVKLTLTTGFPVTE